MNIEKSLEKNPVCYVTRDIERAMGLDLEIPGYFVVANFSEYAEKIIGGKSNVLLIKSEKILATHELLGRGDVMDFINKNKVSVLVFKNNKLIKRICDAQNWKLLNPIAELADKVEAKISQVRWLGDLVKYLPEYKTKVCGEIEFDKTKKGFLGFAQNDKSGESFILQFNHSHSGEGTFLINSKEELEKIKEKFPKREARISKYIQGPTFTNNNIVHKDGVLVGSINYQITGLRPFTDLKFATVGNDWGVVKNILNNEQVKEYKKIAREVGEKMRESGWLGAFGIDVVADVKTNKLYLIEINARQPASLSFESSLQANKKTITTFEAHIASLLGLGIKNDLAEINNGAQVILKNYDLNHNLNHNFLKRLEKENLKVIEYNNSKVNSDLFRIQSDESIMEGHNEFSELGKKIISIVQDK